MEIFEARKGMAIALLGVVIPFFFACHTETEKQWQNIQLLEDSLSVERATDVTINYTDSGYLKAKIITPLLENYPNKEEPYLEMTEGLKSQFYNKLGAVESNLTAGYGISYKEKKIIIVRQDVVVINSRDEEIKTEELIWDQEKQKVTSEEFVKIRIKDEKILYGQGFESNETFTKYRIKKLSGILRLNEKNN